MREPDVLGLELLIKISTYRQYCLAEKQSWKIKTTNGSFQHCYPDTTMVSKLLWKARATACMVMMKQTSQYYPLFWKLHRRGTRSSGCLVMIQVYFACSCTGCTKWTSWLTFRWRTGREEFSASNIHARTLVPNAFSCSACTISLALISHHTCMVKGKYQLWKLWFSRTLQCVWWDWCNSCWIDGSWTIFHLCIVWHTTWQIHGQS